MKRATPSTKCCRIVLTGGPGGGKTMAADLFRREIAERVVRHAMCPVLTLRRAR